MVRSWPVAESTMVACVALVMALNTPMPSPLLVRPEIFVALISLVFAGLSLMYSPSFRLSSTEEYPSGLDPTLLE